MNNKSDGKKRILIIEDSKAFAKILSFKIKAKFGISCDIANDFSQAKDLITLRNGKYFLALVDLNLPDCDVGEAVDYALSERISSIVVTGDFNEYIREELIKKNIIDYVVKKNSDVISYVIGIMEKIIYNQEKKILIVDDSKSTRFLISKLLKSRKFQVLEAVNGKMAIEALENNSDIELIITDYNMPIMDGYDLIVELRKKYSRDELGIIGISAQGSGYMSAKFLKIGANDFIKKPFSVEEFYQRIELNIELIERTKELRFAVMNDYLTKLNNRRYLFDKGKEIFEESIRKNIPITVAMMDIDFFKKINDRYGHGGGDEVLKKFSELLSVSFGENGVVARIGGEEFCVINKGIDLNKIYDLFEEFRKNIENMVVEFEKDKIKFTVSTGLVINANEGFEKTISKADEYLYKAKETGRNKIVSNLQDENNDE